MRLDEFAVFSVLYLVTGERKRGKLEGSGSLNILLRL
ncbi:hypothetical protein BVRB_5g114570 isoform A [Beta vulgaris subsp. vulgaris]|nr:hypothetical protein BVRB_5g114570 isoform A [Beta vulgaris subsp. vulgaris]